MRLQRQTRKGDWNTVLQASELARVGRVDDYGVLVDAVGSDRITGNELIYRIRLTIDEVARIAKIAGVVPVSEEVGDGLLVALAMTDHLPMTPLDRLG